jgi:hypothetical protein
VPHFHHVNLGVSPGGIETEAVFLVEILGYRPIDPGDELRPRGAHWFETDDGSQVHLSEDAEHRPAARAHVAVDYGRELSEVRSRLAAASWTFAEFTGAAPNQTILCKDPAGNRWELRGVSAAQLAAES